MTKYHTLTRGIVTG